MTAESQRDTAEFILPAVPPEEQKPGVASPQVQVSLGSLSHRGKVRPNNEDHYLVASFGRWLRTLTTNVPGEFVAPPHEEVGYALGVADGMGGTAAGEVASRSAIQALVRLLLSTPDWVLGTDPASAEEVLTRMAGRFHQINELLTQQIRDDPDLTGMGTTLTLACSLGLDLILCHVGDSRAYLFRQGHLRQLTRDMTMAQELVERGALSAAEAATCRWRHVLTQCLGGRETAVAEVQHLSLEDGDRLLLCTDGLTEMTGDAEIACVLQEVKQSQQACQSLVDLALGRGGRDNVTVVLAHFRVQGPKGTVDVAR